MKNTFRLAGVSDRFWNKDQFVEFLFHNQGQPIVLEMDPEAVCLRNLGVYDLLEKLDFRDVTVITANPLESHPTYRIELMGNQWFDKSQQIDPDLHSWNQSRIFYALFGRPTAARLGIAAYLRKHHAQQTHLHFFAKTEPDNLIQFELDKLLHYRLSSINDVADMIDQLPILLSTPDRYTSFFGYDYSDPLTLFYKDILIDIVVESHVAGNTFYPTEKTLRPIWLKKPFIIFASRDYLDYLHQMGFKTFCEFWDESYDGYELGNRLERILHLIDTLANKTRNELASMYREMQSILNYNYDLLKFKRYNTRIIKID